VIGNFASIWKLSPKEMIADDQKFDIINKKLFKLAD